MSNVPPPPPPSSVPPPPPGYPPPGSSAPPPRNGLGTASLVLGILSIVGALFILPILLGVIGLVLGIIGFVRARRGGATNGGIALAGIITSVIGIAAGIALLIFVFVAGDFGSLVECLEDAGDNDARIEQCQRDFEDNLTGG